jgi:predicted metalloprotease with PDZ domain
LSRRAPPPDTVYSAATRQLIADDFAPILADAAGLFGALDAPLNVLLGVNRGGGLEGMYAFSLFSPFDNDSFGWFNTVASHEAVHSWVGVRVGEYDDPWWKEATTNFLGVLIAARQGKCRRAMVNLHFLADLTDSADVRDWPLSSPRVRTHLFAPDSDMTDLVYGKGCQVNMLLDLRIRQASGGATSLDRLLGEFVRQFDGRAFHRQEYVSFLEARSGADISALFATWVDQPGAIPQATLFASLDSLIARGAFGQLLLKQAPAAARAVATPPSWLAVKR